MLGSRDGECDSAKASRRVFDFPLQTLLEYSFLRQDEAARALGVAPITLKRICQRLKYRWPYRMLKAQARREGRTTSKPNQQRNNPAAGSVASNSAISSPFSSPEPEPRVRTDAAPPSLYVHLPRLKSLPYHRHLEFSHELQQQPHGHQRLPSISTLTASLARNQQLPIRLPNLFPAAAATCRPDPPKAPSRVQVPARSPATATRSCDRTTPQQHEQLHQQRARPSQHNRMESERERVRLTS